MKKKQLKFGRGIRRIVFPVLGGFGPLDYEAEIKKIQRLKLPKYSVIGFEARHYKETKDYPAFTNLQVFIEK